MPPLWTEDKISAQERKHERRDPYAAGHGDGRLYHQFGADGEEEDAPTIWKRERHETGGEPPL